MKAIERNISRHRNGTYYFVARRGGKLVVRSFGTKELAVARGKLRDLGVQGIVATRRDGTGSAARPAAQALPGAVVESSPSAAPVESLAVALAEHDRGLVLLSAGAREMAASGKKAVETFATSGWVGFSPVAIWHGYRQSGVLRFGRELGSAANHLRWYLRRFVPWAVERGLLPTPALAELRKIPKVRVNPRRIRVPEPAQVDEFLKMVSSEDPVGGAFLRFLAATGLRRSGACGLTWRDVDFGASTLVVRQKGGKEKVLPVSPEALELLRGRAGQVRPWALGSRELEVLDRRTKRFAKGLDLDLTTFHSFRHYFASRCLMAGLTVQETAALLGHSDGGVLVLRVYGHISTAHLKTAVSNLRTTCAIPPN